MYSSKPHIGILAWDYQNPKGGLGRSFQWFEDALRSHNVDVTVASPTARTPLLAFTARFGGHILFSLLLPFVLGSWIKRHTVTRLLLPVGPGGVFLLRKPSLPYTAVAFHTYHQQVRLVPGQWWKRLFLPLERRTLLHADRVLCFCDDTKCVLIDAYRIPADRITLLAHALAVTADTQPKQEGLCVCIARLEARKGIPLLLHAWPKILAAVPHAALVIVGSGVQARSIDRVIMQLGPSAQRIPHLPREELSKLLQSASVAVCPSYLEGFGLAAAEAMAAGTALVVTDVDGLRSLVTHNETGLLVQPGSADAIAAGVCRLLTDSSLRHILGQAALHDVLERFDPIRTTDIFVSAITGRA